MTRFLIYLDQPGIRDNREFCDAWLEAKKARKRRRRMKKEAEKKDRANKISINKKDIEKIKNNSGSWGSPGNTTQMVTLVGGKRTKLAAAVVNHERLK